MNTMRRGRGKLLPRPNYGDFPRWRERRMVLPRSEWRPIDRRRFFPWITDQGRRNSCVADAACGALRRARALAGMADVQLSPGALYSIINRGVDEGARISDALWALTSYGTVAYDVVGHDPHFLRTIPREVWTSAQRFRIAEAYHARSFDELASGIQLGFWPVFGIEAGEPFFTFDKDGVAGYTSGPGNHALTADGMALLPGERWAIDTVNSHGEDYGEHGRCYLTERHFQAIHWDCFLIRAAADDPEDANTPPPATG